MINSVLVVDDSSAIRQFMDRSLCDLGVNSVDSCADGFAAYKRVRLDPHRYSGLFVDLNMPGMDGIELLRALGETEYDGGVVIVSAMDSRVLQLAVDIAKSHNINLLGCVPKPIKERELAFSVQKMQLNHCVDDNRKGSVLTEGELAEAIRKGYVLPYFQPQIAFPTYQRIGFECLARIDSPTKGLIGPDCFIPLAEKTGMISDLFIALFEKALPQFMRLRSMIDNRNLTLSVNLSPSQLLDKNIPNYLEQKCIEHGLELKNLVVEVTESQVLEGVNKLETFNRLRVKGFSLSLDDFGTGYTNMEQLRSLPFTEIKLDKLLSQGVNNDHVSKILVDAICQISMELGMTVISEGVERIEDIVWLNAVGVQNFQGFQFCRPKPFSEIVRWLHAWEKVVSG
ncbi:MAG: EAL domain-containing response regulator [Pseudomonadales bacterium]|nr:EAL domain-containing response regulator [Pseudomonadales bacterium]